MTILYILLAVVMFGIIIFLHEWGHFAAARLFGVGVTEFAIGMGPKLFSVTGKTGTVYSVRALPIGGFVNMVGEDDDTDDPSSIQAKPLYARMLIVAAGALMNLALGLVLMAGLVALSESIPSTTVESLYADVGGEIGYYEEVPGFPIKAGDTIKKIDGTTIRVKDDLLYEVLFQSDGVADVTVERDGKTLLFKDVPFGTYTESGIVVGNASYIVTTELPKTVWEVAKQAVCRSFAITKMLLRSLFRTVKGEYGTQALSGPVGMIEQVGETAQYGFSSLVFLITVITFNLGLFNLLPLPALDGGRLFFLFLELIFGRPVPQKYEEYVHAAGFVLLMGLMVFVTYQDVVRLFVK